MLKIYQDKESNTIGHCWTWAHTRFVQIVEAHPKGGT
jgi:hypothetical protein